MATGSEVHLALGAALRLKEKGRAVRVVSLPSWELFEAQPIDYRQSVFPVDVDRRVAIEAGRSLGWERYAGSKGRILAVDRFGASAPGNDVFARFGFSVDAVVEAAEDLLAAS